MPEKYPSRESTTYSRLETDDELKERCKCTYTSRVGEELDDYVWYLQRKQRRIIWVNA